MRPSTRGVTMSYKKQTGSGSYRLPPHSFSQFLVDVPRISCMRSPTSMLFPRVSLPQRQGSQEDMTHRDDLLSPHTVRSSQFFRLPFYRSHTKGSIDSPVNDPAKEAQCGAEDESARKKFVIALLGPSGAGKSSFIAHATGQNVKIGHLLNACTDSIDTFEKQLPNDRSVVFVDTPGYDLADKNPNRVLNMLTQWLKAQNAGGEKVTVNAILFFHRITDNRMPVATQSHINRFEKLVGKKCAPKRILLITTMWDEVDPRLGHLREEQLKLDFWKRFMDGGSSVHRYKRSGSSAWEILNPLVGVESEDVPLPSILDNVFHEEPEEEEDLDVDQALKAVEQIYQEQQRLLEKLQEIVHGPSSKHPEALKEVLAAEKNVSGKLGSFLGRLRRQNKRWFRFPSVAPGEME